METTHDAHLFTHRRAHERAARRTRLADELLRYAVVTTLLIIFVRPIGVIVALVWGLGLARRFYHGRVAPRLHRRFVREEMRRCGHGGCAGRQPGTRRRPARPEQLAHEMGDDPRTAEALDWAKTALDELADTERSGRPAETGVVRVADLIEDVVDAFEARASDDGISFRMETDAEGAVEIDPIRLKSTLR